MRYILILFLALVIYACSNEQKPVERIGWSDDDKEKYKSECIQNLKASFNNDETKTSAHCDCVIDRVMKRYLDYESTSRMTAGEKEKYSIMCK
jgi:hypothetical protein